MPALNKPKMVLDSAEEIRRLESACEAWKIKHEATGKFRWLELSCEARKAACHLRAMQASRMRLGY